MKSQFQALQLLSQYSPKSPLDGQMIEAFIEKHYKIPHQRLRNAPNFDFPPLDVYSFIQWLESGSECFKMAKFENRPVILGKCTLSEAEIIGTLLPDGSVSQDRITVSQSVLSELGESEKSEFEAALLRCGLEPDPRTLLLSPKTIPAENDRVVFHKFDLSVSGVGVVRECDPGKDLVEFYCYFLYPSYCSPRRIGYSMHEAGIANLSQWRFEAVTEDNQPTILGNGTSCLRRLNSELEKEGKVWKDKLRRVEPLNLEVGRGGKYWYVSDKLKVVQDVDRGTPVSHLRYISGNYFASHMEASRFQAEIVEMRRDWLANGMPRME